MMPGTPTQSFSGQEGLMLRRKVSNAVLRHRPPSTVVLRLVVAQGDQPLLHVVGVAGDIALGGGLDRRGHLERLRCAEESEHGLDVHGRVDGSHLGHRQVPEPERGSDRPSLRVLWTGPLHDPHRRGAVLRLLDEEALGLISHLGRVDLRRLDAVEAEGDGSRRRLGGHVAVHADQAAVRALRDDRVSLESIAPAQEW